MKRAGIIMVPVTVLAAVCGCTDGDMPPTPPEPVITPDDGADGRLRIMPLSYYAESTTRYTFAGRDVCVVASADFIPPEGFKWVVDGVEQSVDEPILRFTPGNAGPHDITVSARYGDKFYSCSTSVIAVDFSENERCRPVSGASSAKATAVFEYLPAPGQFVGDIKGPATPQEAARWASERLKNDKMISLGSFGGYVVAGFDHSVIASDNGYDFAIRGNAFVSDNGGSNEPGICVGDAGCKR